MFTNKKSRKFLLTALGAAALGGIVAACRLLPKTPLKKYTEACLYLAVMDDEISRNELEGSIINGKRIIFPPRRETLQHRYHMFLNLYKNFSAEKMEEEIRVFEARLLKSNQ